MPPPPNTTPQTATAITTADLPFAALLDVSEAPQGTGYDDCNANQYNAVWYKYTAGACDAVVALLAVAESSSSNYFTVTAVWTGTLPDLYLHTIVKSGVAENWCDSQDSGFGFSWFTIPVQANQTYYFQVVNFFNAVPDVSLSFELRAAPNLGGPSGTLLVPTDVAGFPAAELATADGTILRMITYPACEQAAILPNGIQCVAAETGGTDVGGGTLVDAYEIIAPDYTGIATVTTAMLCGGSGGSPPSPPGPPPPPPPPPPGGCTGTPTVAMDAAVRTALLAHGATNCASFSVLAASENDLNAAGYAIQRTSPPACTMRYRLHKCIGQLTGAHCGHPMCSAYTGGGGSAQDIDIEANGEWAWIPR